MCVRVFSIVQQQCGFPILQFFFRILAQCEIIEEILFVNIYFKNELFIQLGTSVQRKRK